MTRILQDSNSKDLHQSEYESDDEGKNKVPPKDSCNFCNKDFTRKYMKQHIKTFHKIKPDDYGDNENFQGEKPKQLDYTQCSKIEKKNAISNACLGGCTITSTDKNQRFLKFFHHSNYSFGAALLEKKF